MFAKGNQLWTKRLWSKEERNKISEANEKRVWSAESKKRLSLSHKGLRKGKTHTAESKLKMSITKIGQCSGENNPNWKGGITSEQKLQRNSYDAKEWKKAVLERDNWVCQHCEDRGGNLEIHHLYPWSKYPELRFDIDNGITFCPPCHSIYDPIRRV